MKRLLCALTAVAMLLWPAVAGAVGPCDVASLTRLPGMGGDADIDYTTGQVASIGHDQNARNQLYLTDLDGNNKVCLTCVQAPGGPDPRNHKQKPEWHPSGRWLFLTAQVLYTSGNQALEAVANGYLSDLWALDMYTGKWSKLAEYSAVTQKGILHPRVSPDGTKLTWGRLTQWPSFMNGGYGNWRLMMADFVGHDDGTAQLSNVRDVTPTSAGPANMNEPHGWTPDGVNMIITSHFDRQPIGFDLYIVAPDGTVTNLTNSFNIWDEHADYSPDGLKMAWTSSLPFFGWNPRNEDTMKLEMMVGDMSAQGPVRVTGFNIPGSPEYSSERSYPVPAGWLPDGSGILISRVMAGPSWLRQAWVVKFKGNCGRA